MATTNAMDLENFHTAHADIHYLAANGQVTFLQTVVNASHNDVQAIVLAHAKRHHVAGTYTCTTMEDANLEDQWVWVAHHGYNPYKKEVWYCLDDQYADTPYMYKL